MRKIVIYIHIKNATIFHLTNFMSLIYKKKQRFYNKWPITWYNTTGSSNWVRLKCFHLYISNTVKSALYSHLELNISFVLFLRTTFYLITDEPMIIDKLIMKVLIFSKIDWISFPSHVFDQFNFRAIKSNRGYHEYASKMLYGQQSKFFFIFFILVPMEISNIFHKKKLPKSFFK